MTTWYRKQGDVDDFIVVEIKGLDAAGLTAAFSVEGHVRYGAGTAETLTGSVLNATSTPPTVKLLLGDATGWLSDAKIGCWSLETEITFLDDRVLTWPDEGFDTIEVGAQLA